MAQVSKKFLPKNLETRLYQVFYQSFSRLNNSEMASNFIEDLLTPTEKVMLAKRLAIAILISKGWLQESIEETLKVSSATIQSVKRTTRFGGQGFARVVDLLQKEKEWEQMTEDFQTLLSRTFTSRASKSIFVKGLSSRPKHRKTSI